MHWRAVFSTMRGRFAAIGRSALELWNTLVQSLLHGSRSSALKPMFVLLGITAAALILAIKYGAPAMVLTWLLIAAGLILVVALGSFVYLLIRIATRCGQRATGSRRLPWSGESAETALLA